MKILVGYGLLLLYFLLVFLLVGKLAKKTLGVAFSRKIIHILTGFSWFIYDYFIGCSLHQIIICLAFLILSILSRRFNLIKTIENNESKSNGTIYFSIALFVLMTISYFIPSIYPLVGFSIIALAVGDGSATLVGRYIKSVKIYHDKTLFGFIGCIIFSFIALVLYNYLYKNLFDIFQLFLMSLIAGIFEEEDLYGFDNVTVPLSVFIVMILFSNCENIIIPISIFCALFLVCFFSKAMTYHGSLLSSFVGASFYYIGGLKTALYAVSLYLIIIAIHLVRKLLKVKETGIVKKEKGKDLMQVIANGIISLLYMYLYLFLGKQILLIVSLLVFSNSFVDSVASDIGSLSKSKPYDIFKKKIVETGTSGGISVLGSLSAFIASVIFSIAIGLLFDSHWAVMIAGPFVMMICCFTDSLLGSTIQAKYKCEICGLVTEKEEHCGTKLSLVEGYKFFDNDIVNLSCSVLCGILLIPMVVILL